jgi:Protein of unknown function (DUF3567)
MHMLYNSDSYAVVLFDAFTEQPSAEGAPLGDAGQRGGYEIVDKFARKEIFIQGALAESFKLGVEALIQTRPSEEEIDEYIERFASLMQQPLVLH